VLVNGGIHATETIISDADIADNGGTGNNTMAKMREVYDGHNHSGVQAGSDNSSTPNQEM
jgi:hypothetical protein